MQYIKGELVYENCLGVEFQELSVVGDPAYQKAATQYILQKQASRKKVSEKYKDNTIISELLSIEDRIDVAKFFLKNKENLPIAMLRLANKIF
jgi:hypothetical protein